MEGRGMKKTKKTRLTAAIFAAAMGLSGCTTDGESAKSSSEEEKTTAAETTAEVTKTTEFDPAKVMMTTLYAPPEYFQNKTIETTTEDIPEITEYDPADDEIEDVYGPPEWFE